MEHLFQKFIDGESGLLVFLFSVPTQVYKQLMEKSERHFDMKSSGSLLSVTSSFMEKKTRAL